MPLVDKKLLVTLDRKIKIFILFKKRQGAFTTIRNRSKAGAKRALNLVS